MAYTFQSLVPSTIYRVRIVPEFRKGRGASSVPLTFKTLDRTHNYWVRIIYIYHHMYMCKYIYIHVFGHSYMYIFRNRLPLVA